MRFHWRSTEVTATAKVNSTPVVGCFFCFFFATHPHTMNVKLHQHREGKCCLLFEKIRIFILPVVALRAFIIGQWTNLIRLKNSNIWIYYKYAGTCQWMAIASLDNFSFFLEVKEHHYALAGSWIPKLISEFLAKLMMIMLLASRSPNAVIFLVFELNLSNWTFKNVCESPNEIIIGFYFLFHLTHFVLVVSIEHTFCQIYVKFFHSN